MIRLSDVLGLPLRERNRLLEARSPTTAYTRSASFEALDPAAEGEVAGMWKGALRPILQNLKTVVETG